jgi:hypothetical protein
MAKSKPTAKDVAQWMLDQLNESGELTQEDAAYEIETLFGEEFTYANDNGNTAIDRKVLEEFRAISPDTVWERQDKLWRRRDQHDDPGRFQD